jgi:hypothetical protein
MSDLYLSKLNYGFAGAGKTFDATSSFWDHEKGDFKRKGYWIVFGRESNKRITMPTITLDQVAKGEHGQIKFGSPDLNSDEFARKFSEFCRALYKANQGKDKKFESIVIDGMSEFDLLYETVHHNVYGDGNKFAKWDDLLGQFFSAFQILDPDEINAHVVMTARVREVKKKTDIASGDGDFIPTSYMPSVRGQFKTYMPHYFNLVTYFDTTTRMAQVNGKNQRVGVHQAHMVPEDDYLVKNNWADLWVKAGHPSIITNGDFDTSLDIIKGL